MRRLPTKAERVPILLVIAASRHEAKRAMDDYGIDIHRMESIRIVTKAYLLRRWSAGAPFITAFRETWGGSAEMQAMENVLTLRTRCHELRPANERDLAPLMRHAREAAE